MNKTYLEKPGYVPLNREQRRKAEKKIQKQIVHQMTTEKINKAKLRATGDAIAYLMGLPLIVLRDKFGFGKKRLEIFEEALIEQIKCIEHENVTPEEIIKIIEEETGMKIEV
ncbi:MAG: hypothetical protein KH972_08915 [Peptostreptococcaceae bacterium]|nr:hypothetical protein [Peptostreptococcaceae bacterium]